MVVFASWALLSTQTCSASGESSSRLGGDMDGSGKLTGAVESMARGRTSEGEQGGKVAGLTARRLEVSDG